MALFFGCLLGGIATFLVWVYQIFAEIMGITPPTATTTPPEEVPQQETPAAQPPEEVWYEVQEIKPSGITSE